MSELLQWVQGVTVHMLPPVPFELHPSVTVTDASRFLAALKRDASDGKKSPRAAVLEKDVRRIRELCDSETTRKSQDGMF